MSTARDFFGTDGVRGLAGVYPLDKEGTYAIGMAVGTQFAKPGEKIVIACDTRESSPGIVNQVANGLMAVGVNVVLVGVMPTPGLAYITREREDFVAGVMVTASHNTFEFNGIKVFDSNGNKLSSEVEKTLNKLIIDGAAERGRGQSEVNEPLINMYEDFLVGTAPGLSLGYALALDSANGSASTLSDKVFKRLGADVTILSNTPNGTNINENCGATHTEALAKAVVDNKLTLGIAFDGDADRVIFVDSLGREVKGDYLLYILAVTSGSKGVVATVMSNIGFELALKAKGIELIRTAVGDHNVIEALDKTGYKVGGEESGHIVLPDLLQTGDGLLAAVQVLKDINGSGKSLVEWCDEVHLVPQSMVNVPLDDKSLLDKPEVKELIESESAKLESKGRLLIRPSGTEPVVRVMVESDNAHELAEEVAAKLESIIYP